MEKEQFVARIFDSTNGIQKVEPSADLFAEIRKKLQERPVVSLQKVGLIAASIAVLIACNIMILSLKSSKTETSVTALEQSINKSNQLY